MRMYCDIPLSVFIEPIAHSMEILLQTFTNLEIQSIESHAQ
jgi:hypothetical protein